MGWRESIYSGTCIKVFNKETDWHTARSVCRVKQGDLVKIGNYLMSKDVEGKRGTSLNVDGDGKRETSTKFRY